MEGGTYPWTDGRTRTIAARDVGEGRTDVEGREGGTDGPGGTAEKYGEGGTDGVR